MESNWPTAYGPSYFAAAENVRHPCPILVTLHILPHVTHCVSSSPCISFYNVAFPSLSNCLTQSGSADSRIATPVISSSDRDKRLDGCCGANEP